MWTSCQLPVSSLGSLISRLTTDHRPLKARFENLGRSYERKKQPGAVLQKEERLEGVNAAVLVRVPAVCK